MSVLHSSTLDVDVAWSIIKAVDKLPSNVFISSNHDGSTELQIKCHELSAIPHVSLCGVIRVISESLWTRFRSISAVNDQIRQFEEDYTPFTEWICALSLSMRRPPLNQLMLEFMARRAVLHRVVDVLWLNVLWRTLPFLDETHHRLPFLRSIDSLSDDDRSALWWIPKLIEMVPFDEGRILTPELVKRTSKPLMAWCNLMAADSDHIVRFKLTLFVSLTLSLSVNESMSRIFAVCE